MSIEEKPETETPKQEPVTIPEPKLLEPHQLGWLRRKELDEPGIDVWERPDGKLHAQPHGKHLQLQWCNLFMKERIKQ